MKEHECMDCSNFILGFCTYYCLEIDVIGECKQY